tara:strand:- start:57 stop:344 length:288 start_codon:yes stop_codon:yes gene_type:complete
MHDQSIKDTLSVIRKALEEEESPNLDKINDNVLLLNKLVKEDGTINLIKDNIVNKKDTLDLLEKKLDDIFDNHLETWLDKNIPSYLDKYFKNKNL